MASVAAAAVAAATGLLPLLGGGHWPAATAAIAATAAATAAMGLLPPLLLLLLPLPTATRATGAAGGSEPRPAAPPSPAQVRPSCSASPPGRWLHVAGCWLVAGVCWVRLAAGCWVRLAAACSWPAGRGWSLCWQLLATAGTIIKPARLAAVLGCGSALPHGVQRGTRGRRGGLSGRKATGLKCAAKKQ